MSKANLKGFTHSLLLAFLTFSLISCGSDSASSPSAQPNVITDGNSSVEEDTSEQTSESNEEKKRELVITIKVNNSLKLADFKPYFLHESAAGDHLDSLFSTYFGGDKTDWGKLGKKEDNPKITKKNKVKKYIIKIKQMEKDITYRLFLENVIAKNIKKGELSIEITIDKKKTFKNSKFLLKKNKVWKGLSLKLRKEKLEVMFQNKLSSINLD